MYPPLMERKSTRICEKERFLGCPPNLIKHELKSEPVPSHTVSTTIDIELQMISQNFEHSDSRTSTELIKGINLQKNLIENRLKVKNLLRELNEKGLNIEHCIYTYWSVRDNAFVYVGKWPCSEADTIPLDDIHDRLKLKLRPMEKPNSERSVIKPVPAKQEEKKDVPKRNKEQKIGDVIEKVTEWRRYYTGIMDSSGKIVKISLEDSAKKVGIAKKTLDDYLLQLRAGKKYGFDFNLHQDSKIGILRAFVKEKKKEPRPSNPQIQAQLEDESDERTV